MVCPLFLAGISKLCDESPLQIWQQELSTEGNRVHCEAEFEESTDKRHHQRAAKDEVLGNSVNDISSTVITAAKPHKMITFIYIDKTLHFVYNYKRYKR